MLQPLWCEARNTIAPCLPLHLTDLLQPLDVSLFGPLQQHYCEAVEEFFSPISRVNAYTIKNIKTAFKVTGILPLNPRVVCCSQPAFVTYCVSHRKSLAITTCIPENTPYTSMTFGSKLSSLSNFLKKLLWERYAAGSYTLLMLLSTPYQNRSYSCRTTAAAASNKKHPPFIEGHVTVWQCPAIWSKDQKSDSRAR